MAKAKADAILQVAQAEDDKQHGLPGDSIVGTGGFTCKAPPGSVNLNGYPGLVYAPDQWGPRVVVIGSHQPAGDVARARDDENLSVDDLADRFETTLGAVVDAIRYCEANPGA